MTGCLGFGALILPHITEQKQKNHIVQPTVTNLCPLSLFLPPSLSTPLLSYFLSCSDDLGAIKDAT